MSLAHLLDQMALTSCILPHTEVMVQGNALQGNNSRVPKSYCEQKTFSFTQ